MTSPATAARLMAVLLMAVVPLIAPVASAQTLVLDRLTRSDGIVSDGVRVMCQDGLGYLWLGTSEGVSRYDGTSFKNFIEAGNGTGVDIVTALSEQRGKPGTMLIGTYAGRVFETDGNTVRAVLDPADDAPPVIGLSTDSDGGFWVLTYKGLTHHHRQGETQIVLASGPAVFTDFAGGDSACVIAAENMLLALPTRRQASPDTIVIPGRESVAGLARGPQDEIWAVTSGGELFRIDGRRITGHRRLSIASPADIAVEPSGRVWVVGTHGAVVLSSRDLATGPVTRYGRENGFPTDNLISVYCDREGILWFGAFNNALTRWSSPGTVRFSFTPHPAAWHEPIACSDISGHLWVASGEGLLEIVRRTDGTWQRYVHVIPGAITTTPPYAVRLDADGRLWTGIGGTRVMSFTLRPSAAAQSTLIPRRTIRIHDSLATVDLFLPDRRGNVWMNAPRRGLLFADAKDRVRDVAPLLGIAPFQVRALGEDRDGNVWAGTWSDGIRVITPSPVLRLVKQVTKRDGLPGERIRALAADDHGRMWVGMRFDGLAVVDGASVASIGKPDGLASNTAWTVAPSGGAGGGEIYVGSPGGLQRIDGTRVIPETLLPQFDADITSCGMAGDSILWGASAGTLTISILKDELPAAVAVAPVIELFTAGGSIVDASRAEPLPHDSSTCMFDFVSIDLRRHAEIRYSHRMIGVDDAWSQPDTKRSVVYSNLAPGDYVFEVRSVAANGRAFSPAAHRRFTVLPPLTGRWWFRLMVLLAIAGAMFGAHRYRLAQLMKVERTRMRIARDLHDDLGSTLSSITVFARALRQGKTPKWTARTTHLLDRIVESSTGASASIRDIVWAIDPKNDAWDRIMAVLRRFAGDMFEANAIAFTIESDPAMRGVRLSMEQRRQVWLSYKELVANAVRHARCAHVTIRIRLTGPLVTLSFADDGRGFDLAADSQGSGLGNLEARMRAIGGRAVVRSAPGQGTQWELSFPLTYRPDRRAVS